MPFPSSSQGTSGTSKIPSTSKDINPDRSKPVLPAWVPVSLVRFTSIALVRILSFHTSFGMQLAVTTAALAVPLFLIRRQRAAASVANAAKSSTSAPPPRRTAEVAISVKPSPMSSNPIRSSATHSRPSSSSVSAPPPRRLIRLPTASVAPTAASAASPSPAAERPLVLDPSSLEDVEVVSQQELEYDGFNAPLYTLKAFSIASLLVITGGVAGVWAVKSCMGVKDVRSCFFSLESFTQ